MIACLRGRKCYKKKAPRMLKKGSKQADLISPGWAVKVRMLSGDFLEEVIVELKDEQWFNRDAR